MNFDLDDDQRLFAQGIDRLFDAQAGASQRDPAADWAAYRDLGLLALPFAETQGGLGLGPETLMLAMEAYGRTLATAPYLQTVLLGGGVLARADDATLARVLDGELHVALALYEPGQRYRWDRPATKAMRTGEGWALNGAKVAILDADRADLLICPAAIEEGLGLFLVPADAPGVTLRSRPSPDGRTAADLDVASIVLPGDAAIGDPARNREILAATIDTATTACCAEMVGAMDRLLVITTEYLGMRRQFGAPLGSFQALQHRAADMLVAIEQARSITFHAVAMFDAEPGERTKSVAAAKALVNRAARLVGTEAVQLHGGMGLAAEYPAGRYFQRLTVLETLFGDTDAMLAVVEAA